MTCDNISSFFQIGDNIAKLLMQIKFIYDVTCVCRIDVGARTAVQYRVPTALGWTSTETGELPGPEVCRLLSLSVFFSFRPIVLLHAVWSAIGMILASVCQPVRLSVTKCTVAKHILYIHPTAKVSGSAVGNTSLQLLTPTPTLSPQILYRLNRRLWCRLVKRIYWKQANRRNFHVSNNHRQHVARIGLYSRERCTISSSSSATAGLLVNVRVRFRYGLARSVLDLMYAQNLLHKTTHIRSSLKKSEPVAYVFQNIIKIDRFSMCFMILRVRHKLCGIFWTNL